MAFLKKISQKFAFFEKIWTFTILANVSQHEEDCESYQTVPEARVERIELVSSVSAIPMSMLLSCETLYAAEMLGKNFLIKGGMAFVFWPFPIECNENVTPHCNENVTLQRFPEK